MPVLRLAATWFVAATCFGLCLLLRAAPRAAQNMQAGSNPGVTVTSPLQIAVTGCLKREAKGEYYIADKNGRTWNLVPNGVKLSSHLNQEVMVTGKPATDNQQQSDKQVERGKHQLALQVVTVKPINSSCGP